MAATETDHAGEAVRLLERADWIANRDTWHGDRAADVANTRAEARVHAMLALAAQTQKIANLLGLALDGEHAFHVKQTGVTITREDRP